MGISLTIKAGFLPRDEAERVARVLSATVMSLVRGDARRSITDVSLLAPQDLEQLWAWNATVPDADDDLIREQAQRRPDTEARTGSISWVVDPDNHESLLPPGCIGELLLEGAL